MDNYSYVTPDINYVLSEPEREKGVGAYRFLGILFFLYRIPFFNLKQSLRLILEHSHAKCWQRVCKGERMVVTFLLHRPVC